MMSEAAEATVLVDHWEVGQLGLGVWFVYRNGEAYAPGWTSEAGAIADMHRLIKLAEDAAAAGPVTVEIVKQ